MENYTITKLAEMFKTTRTTVYKKFNDASIVQYLSVDDKGTRTLLPEGMNVFTMLMASSRIASNKQEVDDSNTSNMKQQEPNNYSDEHIRILNEQIAYLKDENARIQQEKAEISTENKRILDEYFSLTKQTLLTGNVAEGNKKWYQFWQK